MPVIPFAGTKHTAAVRPVLKAKFAAIGMMKDASCPPVKVLVTRPDDTRKDIIVVKENNAVFSADNRIPDRIGGSEL